MADCLFSAKPSPESMLTNCQEIMIQFIKMYKHHHDLRLELWEMYMSYQMCNLKKNHYDVPSNL